jgi:predicted MFS family arabinose efflux permease
MTALVVIAFGNSYLIETRHAPASYPAYALGIYGVVKLTTAPAGGWLLDRVRPVLVIAFVYACEAAGLLIILGTATANGFLVGVGFLSTGIALAWLVVFHALGDASEADVRASATAYVGLVSAGATGAGFALAAILGQVVYWQSAFLLALCIATATALLMLKLNSRTTMARHRRDETPDATNAAPFERRRRLFVGVVIFFHFFAVTGTLSVFGPFVLRSLHLSLLRAGILLLPACGAAAISMVVMGRMSRHGKRLREVATLYALGALAIFAAAFVHQPWLFAVIALPLAVAIGGAQPLLNASLLDVSHAGEDTGTVLGWLFFAEGLGSVAGPLLIGVAISAGGIRDAVIALSVLECGIVVLASVAARSARI